MPHFPSCLCRLSVALLTVVPLLAALPAGAQSPVGRPAEPTVLERLQAAEKRLAEIEARQSGATASTTVPPAAGRATVAGDGTAGDDPTGDGLPNTASAGDEDGSAQPTDSPAQDTATPGAALLKSLQTDLNTLKDVQAAAQKTLAAAKEKPTFKIGGRIHTDYWTFPETTRGIDFFEHPDPASPQFGTDPESRFLFRRVRLETQGEVPDLMLYRLQVDFANPSEPTIKDVYIGTRLPGNQTLLVGNQKRPLGLDHLNSSRFNVFMERPLPVDAFNNNSRRLGVAMYGYTDDLLFNWRYGVFNLQDIQIWAPTRATRCNWAAMVAWPPRPGTTKQATAAAICIWALPVRLPDPMAMPAPPTPTSTKPALAPGQKPAATAAGWTPAALPGPPPSSRWAWNRC